MKEQRRSNWISKRHQVFRNTIGKIYEPIAMSKYNTRIEHYDYDGQYLILYNHQTPYDQFFVEYSFKKHIYFLATEDIFSNGFTSKLLCYFLGPVPIKKSTVDIGALRACLKVVKEGGSLAIAPEGNRTYSGRTEYINPSIAGLAKKLGIPVLLFRIEGGYGVEPRWSDKARAGENRAYVYKEISKEELESLSNEEIYQLIVEGLDVKENVAGSYKSEKRAEYIERMIYVCPDCGFSQFESNGNEFWCKKCNKKSLYGEDKTICGIGYEHSFKFAADWYDFQNDFVNKTDVTKLTDSPIFVDETNISKVILYERKDPLYKNIKSKLYGNKIVFEKDKEEFLTLMFDDISGIAVLGRNKLNVYHKDMVYQFSGNKRFNALKYLNIYTRYNNIKRGDQNVEFLGL